MTDQPRESGEREQRLQDVIAAYLDAEKEGAAPARDEWLARYPDLADDLRRFLDNHAWANRLAEPFRPEDTSPASPPVLGVVRYFGDYELLVEVARGAMGVVYRARQVSLNRTVALKMILAGQLAGPAEVRRFHAEAEAAANLDHPHIVPIYEVGEHEGQHYFSMKLVEGGSLAGRLGEPGCVSAGSAGRLPPDEAARLVATVARAVHFAHQRGILHRDLKPANILLDRDGTPLVTDFGLARRVEGEGGQTQSGAVVGTPEYMAPEQARAEKQPTIAVDVWALGVILYDCLTGVSPFRAATVFETLGKVVSEEPVSPRQLNAKVPRDLETICLKCLSKEPRKRFTSALELAEDLGRFLRGEPVAARPVGRLERAWRWCRRNPVVASLLALVMLSLVVGTTVSTLFAVAAAQQARVAQEKAEAARQAERLARQRAYGSDMLLTQVAWEQNQVKRFLQLLEEQRPRKVGDEDFRGFEWFYWKRQFQRGHITLRGHTNGVSSVAFSADGKRIVSGGNDKMVTVWDAHTGQEIRTLKGHTNEVTSVAFSPDSKRIVSGSVDQTVKVWDAHTGQEIRTLKGHTHLVTSVAFSADGKRIASGSRDWMVKVWDAHTGQEQRTLQGHTSTVESVAFSPDGNRIASGGGDQTVKVWDAQTGQQLLSLKGHTNTVWSVAFSPDGTRIASGSWDMTVRVWDAQTGREQFTLTGHTGSVYSVAFSSDGKHIVSGSDDQTVKVWDAQTGQATLTLKGHTWTVRSVAFSPDSKRIASGSADKTVKVWDAHAGQEPLTLRGHAERVQSVAFSPDGRRIVSGSGDWDGKKWVGEVKVWEAQTGQETLTLKGHTAMVSSVAFSADGRRIVSGSNDNTVKVWDAHTGQEIRTLKGHTHWVTSVAFSADGKRIVSGSWDGTVKVWDVQTGQEQLSLKGYTDFVSSVAFSADGKRLASGGQDSDQKKMIMWGEVKVWDAHTGQLERTLQGHRGVVNSVAFSADGRRLASGGQDQRVKVWDAHTGQELFTLQGHTNWVTSVAFSADGQRLASGSGFSADQPGEVKVWDAQTGQEVLTLKGHTGPVSSVAFSPDGKRLASASYDKTVKVWDASDSPK